MTALDQAHLQQHIAHSLQSQLSASAWQWLAQSAEAIAAGAPRALLTAFARAPRKTSPSFVVTQELPANEAGLQVHGWDSVRLVRVYLLMHIASDDREAYLQHLGDLFTYADMDEAVALYSALPVLAWPEAWVHQCTEGLRSNIGYVHDALMQANPWPARHLPESAWNQLVLKAFFNEKDMSRVIGLEARNNAALVASLTDYRAERQAAGRPVHPLIEQLIADFAAQS